MAWFDLSGKVSKLRREIAYALSKKHRKVFDVDIKMSEGGSVFPDILDQYGYFHDFFWHKAPRWLRDHRAYFKECQRGFGEDAFHAMWYLIFRDFKPGTALEIGVYRGQAISLWGLLSRYFGLNTEIHGISPFTPAGDSVSTYLKNVDYYNDVLANFREFGLETPRLHKGYSTDKEMRSLVASREWDLIYIDGSHDYEIVKEDFLFSGCALRKGGLIVLDDSALYVPYAPYLYSSAGHPGPSRVASEIDPGVFTEIISCGHNRVFKKVS